MIEFARPWLLLLAPAAALLAWRSAGRRRPALRFPDLRLVDGLPTGRAVRARWGGAVLRGLAGVALAVACAGPRRPDLTTAIPAEGIAIVVALDVSGSMGQPDFAWNPGSPPVSRLEAAKRVFRLFVAGGEAPDGTRFDPRETDQVGLVVFAAWPRTACPLTLNHSVLLKVLDDQQPRGGLDAGTNIGDAIAEGLLRLDAAGERRKKVLVLLSDGEHNATGDGPDAPFKPRQAAHLAAALRIPVYAIDAGGDPAPDAAPEDAKQRADGRRILQSVAEMTGARSFPANDGGGLVAAVKEIDRLERTSVVGYQYRRYFEYYPWFAAAAVVLLVLAHALERTRWRILP